MIHGDKVIFTAPDGHDVQCLKLKDGTFVRAFRDKGRFSTLLESVPVRVILDPKTALRGAAYYLASMGN